MSISRDEVLEWVKATAAVLKENRDYLTELDSAIGDADHGANMDRGFNAVMSKMPDMTDKDIGTIFKTVGMTLVSTVGGAGGPLYGTFYLQAGMKSAGKMELNLEDWTMALEAAVDGVVMRGKAELGDKTMVDALTPAVNSLKSAVNGNTPFSEALKESAEAAKDGITAIGRYTDAGVPNRESQRDIPPLFAGEPNPNLDLPHLGKLDGVADQVHENLAQTD